MEGEAAELRDQRERIQRGKRKGSKSLCKALRWDYTRHLPRMLKRPFWLESRMGRGDKSN